MPDPWTLSELVEAAAMKIAALPAPKNGQVRAVPDERTVRYYGTIGLLDRPIGSRGRTALYGPRHLAQIVAIKRMQAMGRSLAEIQALWPTLDAMALQRMAGVALDEVAPVARGRAGFWKAAPADADADVDLAPNLAPDAEPARPPAPPRPPAPSRPPQPPTSRARRMLADDSESAAPSPTTQPPAELRITVAPNIQIVIAVPATGIALTHADLEAIHASAAPLVAELLGRIETP